MSGHGLLSIIQRSVNGTAPPQSKEPRGRRLRPCYVVSKKSMHEQRNQNHDGQRNADQQ